MMDCTYFLRLALTLTVSVLPFCVCAFTVVIDPGHGKGDHGAVGKTSSEKNINLDVALKVGKLIEKNFPEVELVFTRNDDSFVTLQGRADIANKAKGDLFISIHTNSVDKKSPNYRTVAGASVYTLGFRRSKENLEVAMRENAVMKLEDDYTTTYQGFDPSSAESYIIFEMNRDKHMEQSLEAANYIQKELVTTAGRKDRGVRQANFWVLFKTGMPAILVELDFICNPEMERFMTSKKGSDRLAEAIYNGFARYKAADDRRRGIEVSAPRTIQPSAPAVEEEPDAQEEEINKPEEPIRTLTDNRIIYKVQFLISPTPIKAGSPKFKGLTDVESYTQGGIVKYTSGAFTTEAKAKKHLTIIRKKFPDAFIIKTQGGQRIK